MRMHSYAFTRTRVVCLAIRVGYFVGILLFRVPMETMDSTTGKQNVCVG